MTAQEQIEYDVMHGLETFSGAIKRLESIGHTNASAEQLVGDWLGVDREEDQ